MDEWSLRAMNIQTLKRMMKNHDRRPPVQVSENRQISAMGTLKSLVKMAMTPDQMYPHKNQPSPIYSKNPESTLKVYNSIQQKNKTDDLQ